MNLWSEPNNRRHERSRNITKPMPDKIEWATFLKMSRPPAPDEIAAAEFIVKLYERLFAETNELFFDVGGPVPTAWPAWPAIESRFRLLLLTELYFTILLNGDDRDPNDDSEDAVGFLIEAGFGFKQAIKVFDFIRELNMSDKWICDKAVGRGKRLDALTPLGISVLQSNKFMKAFGVPNLVMTIATGEQSETCPEACPEPVEGPVERDDTPHAREILIPLKSKQSKKGETPVWFAEALILLKQTDGRISDAEIARRLGLNQSTMSRYNPWKGAKRAFRAELSDTLAFEFENKRKPVTKYERVMRERTRE